MTLTANETKMLRLFYLVCDKDNCVTENVLTRDLTITQTKARQIIKSLVKKNKIIRDRKSKNHIWNISKIK